MKNDNHKWDNKHPTAQMLGRWQPWHAGHTALFEKALSKTGQVVILVRDVEGWQDNPFSWTEVITDIRNGLGKAGYRYGVEYIIMKVPNIVDISYGRGVGYTFTEHDLGAEIHDISATRIRKEMREKGDL